MSIAKIEADTPHAATRPPLNVGIRNSPRSNIGELNLDSTSTNTTSSTAAAISEPMFDLGLLRIPTFNGGLVAAWGVSASIFAMLTYLVLYLQNILGYSALQTGVRFLPLSGAIFVVAAIAGRLSSVVPVRWLIGPGFVLVGVGLLLMRGVEPGQSWTHLLPGLIVAGAGAGLINPPLASTAVGVVAPQRAGMASGINSTLRQVGIATGVAALGSILTSRIHASVLNQLSSGPLAGDSSHLATDISSCSVRFILSGALSRKIVLPWPCSAK